MHIYVFLYIYNHIYIYLYAFIHICVCINVVNIQEFFHVASPDIRNSTMYTCTTFLMSSFAERVFYYKALLHEESHTSQGSFAARAIYY